VAAGPSDRPDLAPTTLWVSLPVGASCHRSVGDLRPRAEVVLAQPANLAAEVARVSPHLVISSRPREADPSRTLAWVELPYEPGLAGRICFGTECLEAHDLNLESLLEVVDKTELLARA
jgi:hypothetical protein